MITKFSGDGLWFTSDSHFNHSAILKFCSRPFNTTEEHDLKLIENWNSVVGPEDTVFHLGDFCFGGRPKWKEIREQLNGHIILIWGNHDDRNRTMGIDTLFDYTSYQMRISIDGRIVYLNHFPFLTFAHGNPDLYNRDSLYYQLFGHVHSGPLSTSDDLGKLKYLYPTQYDVGMDNNDYFPVSWEKLNNIIECQIDNYLNKI